MDFLLWNVGEVETYVQNNLKKSSHGLDFGLDETASPLSVLLLFSDSLRRVLLFRAAHEISRGDPDEHHEQHKADEI